MPKNSLNRKLVDQYFYNGEYDKAYDIYLNFTIEHEQSIKEFKDNPESKVDKNFVDDFIYALIQAGIYQEMKEHYEDALKILAVASDLNAVSADYAQACVYMKLAKVMKADSKLDEFKTFEDFARVTFEEAETKRLANYNENYYVYYNLARALEARGRYNDAEKCFRNCIGLKPNYALAHLALAETLESLGETEKAEKYKTNADGIMNDPDFTLSITDYILTDDELSNGESAGKPLSPPDMPLVAQAMETDANNEVTTLGVKAFPCCPIL